MIQGISEAPQIDLVRGDGRAPAGAGAGRPARIPAVESLSSFIGVDGTNTTLNSGRMLINLKPRERARRVSATEVIRRLQPKLAEVDGHRALHAAGAGPDHRGPRQPHAVPVHARGRRRRRSSASGCRSWSSGCSSCRSSPTSPATCRTAACRPTSRSTATPRPPRHHAGGDRQRALQRLRPAPGLDDLHPVEPVPRRPRGRARVPATARRRSTTSTCRRRPAAAAGAAVGDRAGRRADRAACDQPPRPVSRRRRSRSTSRPAPRSARRSRRSSRRKREIGLPASMQTSFQGAALAFQASLAQRAAADPRRDRHDVHRARRALRELHPSDHDPLDAAVGRASARCWR